ncbi:DENN domain-containing protein 5B, partial [Clarias magur]
MREWVSVMEGSGKRKKRLQRHSDHIRDRVREAWGGKKKFSSEQRLEKRRPCCFGVQEQQGQARSSEVK